MQDKVVVKTKLGLSELLKYILNLNQYSIRE